MRETEKIYGDPGNAGAAEIADAVRALARRYPFLRAAPLGASAQGRELIAVEAGALRDPVFFVGGTHAMEWPSVLCALRLAEETAALWESDGRVCGCEMRASLRRRGAVILPLLNPDGWELRRRGPSAAADGGRMPARLCGADFCRWQANARGVDLNRNFPAGFAKARRAAAALGIRRPGPTRYGGPFPFSEPETRAVRRACADYRPRALCALHAQGQEIYWRYGARQPAGSEYIARTLAALSGYVLAEPDPVAAGAGLKDWFIRAYGRPGFTIELGLGRNPLPYGDFPAIYEKVRAALFAAMLL
ncbi:MAG: M14 family zinc carboxypeptidase [Oscillospiraceae bacterium]|nr:M14 family zinc carboxypeptidase [Oscillospiraceae bacterium]